MAMNTLVISYEYPLPEIGGNRIRTMNLVRYFKQFGDVDIVYFQDFEAEKQTCSVFRNEMWFDISKKPNRPNRIRDIYERVRYTKPWIACCFSKEVVQDLVDLIEQGDYDHVVGRYAANAYPLFFVSAQNRKKVIVDIDDLMTPDLYKEVYGSLRRNSNLKSFLDMILFRRYQIRCAQIGKALVCSEHDKDLLSREAPSADIFVVPNIAPEMSLPDTYNRDGFNRLDTMLFVGNLGYMPNVSGLAWFVETIFVRLQAENPNLKLLVVGKSPAPAVEKISEEHARIELVKNPPDILQYYERCGVVIVPLLSGGGTRIKILESGRALRPVISTPTGAYGLSLHDRQEILLMNDFSSFKKQFDWLHISNNYSQLVNNMSHFVENNFTREHFERAMDRVIGINNMRSLTQGTPGLVSVIVPVYNRENLVGRTIESILAQTYPDIEVIAINDGSIDGSLEVLKIYADRYPGKVVIVDQQNAGQVCARNIGIQHSHGEFIAFLDSDDTWDPQKLAKQLPLFTRDVGLVYCGIHEVDPDGKVLNTVGCEQGLNGNIYQQLLVKNRMTGGTVVVSRIALESAGWFDESFQAAENWDLWIRIARKFAVEYVDEPLLNYLKHPGNMSCNSQKMSRAAWDILQKHLPPSSRNGKLRRVYDHAYANYYYNQAVVNFSNGDYPQARIAFLLCWRYRLLYRDSMVRMLRSLLGKRANNILSACKKRAHLLAKLIMGEHDPASSQTRSSLAEWCK
jgi:glycosyltransferase involved in cell wall biosynthesis